MSEDSNSVAQKIKKIDLKQENDDSGIRTVECKDSNGKLVCELSHTIDENNKYLPILTVYNSNISRIEIQNLESNSEAKAIIDKILELRIPVIVSNGLIEAESMCYLMKSGTKAERQGI